MDNHFRKYYFDDLRRLVDFLIPTRAKTWHVKEKQGKLIPPKKIQKYEYIVLKNIIGDLVDVQESFSQLLKYCTPQTRILITYYNHLWEPILKFATFLGWRRKVKEQNWLDHDDIENLLHLTAFDVITRQMRLLIPINISLITILFNRWLANLPILNNFCLTTWLLARPAPKSIQNATVSIIVPARNEEGNIPNIISKIPKFGKWQEIIFVEGNSKDKTWQAIQKEIKRKHPKHLKIKVFKQQGKGKADAVRLGFSKAKGKILMILDADLAVDPLDLTKFYKVLTCGKGEFANGSRLVYPMEKDAMRTLNKIGNSTFSGLFTWILGQRFRDTLCGTKALFMKDYEKITEGEPFFGNFDPFGDFELIFGAIKQNLKVVEIPVRYRERTYGSTNINRFKHGLLLSKMVWIAYKKFKSW